MRRFSNAFVAIPAAVVLLPMCAFGQSAAEAQQATMHGGWLEPSLKSISIYLASGVEGFAAIIIGCAAIEATVRVVVSAF